MIRVIKLRSTTQSLAVRAFSKKVNVDKTVNKGNYKFLFEF